MNSFQLKNKVSKTVEKTDFGLVSVTNIRLDPTDIENILPNIVFNDDNIKFVFQMDNLNPRSKFKIYNRFIPQNFEIDINRYSSMEEYINNLMKNPNFYSFLAEGMLPLVFRDIYGYNLVTGIIDINHTLNDSHTGADVCLYDKDNEIIVLGEAKFYNNFNGGINCIIDDFINKKSIYNKIDNFKRCVLNNDITFEFIIKNFNKSEFDSFSLQEFMNQKIIFAGFVLHDYRGSIDKYFQSNCYDNFNIDVEKLKSNIEKHLNIKILKNDYEIVMLHLPIESKKLLIKKMIQKAQNNIKSLSGDK